MQQYIWRYYLLIAIITFQRLLCLKDKNKIVLSGFNFVIEREFLKFLGCCLLATIFHTSSVIALVWYFIYRPSWNHFLPFEFCF